MLLLPCTKKLLLGVDSCITSLLPSQQGSYISLAIITNKTTTSMSWQDYSKIQELSSKLCDILYQISNKIIGQKQTSNDASLWPWAFSSSCSIEIQITARENKHALIREHDTTQIETKTMSDFSFSCFSAFQLMSCYPGSFLNMKGISSINQRDWTMSERLN